MNESEAFDAIINMLTEHNIRKEEYLLKYNGAGCFNVKICPKRHVVIDVMYFLENVRDVKVFKIKNVRDIMYLVIKIKIRECD